MKGLKRLLRINENSHVIKQTTSEVTTPNGLENRMDNLSQALAQIMQTEIFQIEQDETTQQTQLILTKIYSNKKSKQFLPKLRKKLPINSN